MNFERYIPNDTEISNAENIMSAENMISDEQRESSTIREKYHEQEQAPWQSFDDKIDGNFVRKKPSPEIIRHMDQRLEELGDVLGTSNLHWHLDGALNISLLNGAAENGNKYIGEHKDVDLSVEENELEALESHLLRQGYGFFLSRTENQTQNKIMKRVNYRDFKESNAEHVLIAAINEQGKIRHDRALNMVDVHIISRDSEGNALSASGIPIPQKWLQPYPIDFHGRNINLSHPAKVLFYKLQQSRNYDATDIDRLIETGRISQADITDISQVLEQEYEQFIERGRKIVKKIADKISPNMNADEILSIFKKQPELSDRNVDNLRTWAEKIAETQDRSADAILHLAMSLYEVEKKQKNKMDVLQKINERVTRI